MTNDNVVNTLSAVIKVDLNFKNVAATGLSVGQVTDPGIDTTSSGDVNLNVAGQLSLDKSIAALTHKVEITAGAGVKENGTAIISSDKLNLHATTAGKFLLTNDNVVNTLSALIKGDLNFKNVAATGLSVGQVTDPGIDTTSSGDVTLNVAGQLNLDKSIAALTHKVEFTAGAGVKENGTAIISSDKL